MSSAEIIRLIRKHGLRVFTTTDILTLTGLKPAAATHALRRLASRDLLVRLKRSVWASRLIDVDAYEALGALCAPWPAYVSLHSALADYGVVEEIPRVVYAVSPAMPRRYRTALGEFRIHHLPTRLFWGYETRGLRGGSYPVADKEKAFLDLIYLALTPRSELELPHKRHRAWDLDEKKLRLYAERFRYEPLTAWLRNEGLLAKPQISEKRRIARRAHDAEPARAVYAPRR